MSLGEGGVKVWIPLFYTILAVPYFVASMEDDLTVCTSRWQWTEGKTCGKKNSSGYPKWINVVPESSVMYKIKQGYKIKFFNRSAILENPADISESSEFEHFFWRYHKMFMG
jgi:hypothetical protein